MTLPPLPEPLVMVNRYGQGASTSDGDGGVFTAAQMTAYATAAVLAEREACAKVCEKLPMTEQWIGGGPFTFMHQPENCAGLIRARKD